MDQIDYSEVKALTKKYKERFSGVLTVPQIDLVDEMLNKLDDLASISEEVTELINLLMPADVLSPDESDVVTFASFKLKLNRADPNVPIKLDNATRAYSRGESQLFTEEEVIKKQQKLERAAIEFYQAAHRVTHIAESLPGLESFQCPVIRIVRNQLIEHPEKKSSGVTHDSFSYSKNEGPFIKGLRIGNQTQHMDQGLKKNSDEFISALKRTLKNALTRNPSTA